jgi:DUF1680 family protein
VTLAAGLFKTCQDRHRQYLLDCWSAENWTPAKSAWTGWLPASNEGRMLRGAAELLRWGEDAVLRAVVDTIVGQIAARQDPDGYALPYERDFMKGAQSELDERRLYDRIMWTRGLLAAAYAGSGQAGTVLRRFYDWLNPSPYMAAMLEGSMGFYGHTVSAMLGLSPWGSTDDFVAGERFYAQDWMLDQLTKGQPLAVYKYPLNRSHCYHPSMFEAYLDQYRGTGDERYLTAVRSAWDMYRSGFVHPGGSPAICEGGHGVYPPGSYWLTKHTGETCGGVFWIDCSHRLLQLFPEEEKYASEIEKTIYNVGLANQEENGAIRYHTHLHGAKEKGTRANTCCENMATGLYSALPQYIFSLAPDGVFVNLFAGAAVEWERDARKVRLALETDFPAGEQVRLRWSLRAPERMKLRVRVPAWVAEPVAFAINGERIAEGQPGSYATFDREWHDGDELSFTVAMRFRVARYTGFDQIQSDGAGRLERYWLEYGPLLMALVGPQDERYRQANRKGCARLPLSADALPEALERLPGHALRFGVRGCPEQQYWPYHEVGLAETFTCFPILGHVE